MPSRLFNVKRFLLISTAFLLAGVTHAQDYSPLAPIPQLTGPGDTTTATSFIEKVVPFVIGIAAALAVIRIIIGGLQYMSTDAWGGKSEARSTIQNAIFGLLLAMGAYAILYTVNPNLVNFNLGSLSIKDFTTGSLPIIGEKTQRTAAETGCTNCVFIDAAEYTVSPAACSNDPCYVRSHLQSVSLGTGGVSNSDTGLVRALALIKTKLAATDDQSFVAWQITRAFPPASPTTTGPTCFMENQSDTGDCIHISLPRPEIMNIYRLLDALPNGQYRVEYRVSSPQRANTLRSLLRPGPNNGNPLIKENHADEIICRQPTTATTCADRTEYLFVKK